MRKVSAIRWLAATLLFAILFSLLSFFTSTKLDGSAACCPNARPVEMPGEMLWDAFSTHFSSFVIFR